MKSAAELAADQVAFWNGPGGQRWVASHDRIQETVVPFGRDLLAAADARPGEQALDIGCGAGATTAALAAAVGSDGRVLGVDISEPLVALARRQPLRNATFAIGDATVYPFETAAFDLVFSRFGVMFFAEPVIAFTNLRRALKPSGRLVFMCWRSPQENLWTLVPLRAAQPHLPPMERPGPEDPGQYAFGDRARVERILGAAGFGRPSFQPVDHPVRLGRDLADAVEGATNLGPLARPLAQAAPEQAAAVRQAVSEALAPHVTADGVALPGACWLVRAAQH